MDLAADFRQTMIRQDAIFKEQVRELHRVYHVQKILMEEAKLQQSRRMEFNMATFGSKNSNTIPSPVSLVLASSCPPSSSISPPVAPVPRRRTFDLERPAEEYMDVEMDENEKVPEIGAGGKITNTPVSSNLPLNPPLHLLNPPPLVHPAFQSPENGGFLSSSAKNEAEILQMIKRSKGPDEMFRAPGFVGASWAAYPQDHSRMNNMNIDHKNKNGYHQLADDKGSLLLKSEICNSLKFGDQQHIQIPFLESAMNTHPRIHPQQQQNPLDSKDFNSLAAAYGFPSYSAQGIFLPNNPPIPSRKDESALGLWWKSSQNSSNYYLQQPTQLQHLQQQQSYANFLQPQIPWQQGPGFGLNPQSFGLNQQSFGGVQQQGNFVQQLLPGSIPAAPSPQTTTTQQIFKEDPTWLKNSNNGNIPSSYSAQTPPKPPYKKPHKLVLDGTTMELKLAPSSRIVDHFQNSQNGMDDPSKNVKNSSNESSMRGILDMEKPPPPAQDEDAKDSNLLGLLCNERPLDKHEDSCSGTGLVEVKEALNQEIKENVEQVEQIKEIRPISCSCSQAGCSLCSSKESLDEEQQNGKDLEENVETTTAATTSTTTAKRRRFKQVNSKDLATRESVKNNSSKSKESKESGGSKPDIEHEEGGAPDRKKRKIQQLQQQQQQPPPVQSSRSSKLSRHTNTHTNTASSSKDNTYMDKVAKNNKNSGKACGPTPEEIDDGLDDGANLAAEILVSLAPMVPSSRHKIESQQQQQQPPEVSVSRHKSKRRLIDTLSPPPPPAPPVAAHPNKSTPTNLGNAANGKEHPKKKRRKSASGKEEQPPAAAPAPKVSVKSLKVSPSYNEDHSSNNKVSLRNNSSAATTKKKVIQSSTTSAKGKNHHHPSTTTTQNVSSRSAANKTALKSSSSPTSKVTTGATTVNLVISKNSRDGVHHHHHHHHYHHHHQQQAAAAAAAGSGSENLNNKNNKYCNNSSEQESLDRLSQPQQQSSGNSSEDFLPKDSDEVDESSWSRRSWGPSTRRKRMSRGKRTAVPVLP